MKLTRKELLVGGAAGAALGAAGIYELVDRLADSPTHFGEGREPEQHLLDGMRIEHSEGVEVVIPTRHHQMVTAKIADSPGSLADARAALSEVLQKLDDEHPGTPEGLAITVAWGLPYFHTHVPAAAAQHLPFDRRAGKHALLDARRFPSDPPDARLEDNDVAFLFRTDHQEHIQKAATEIFDRHEGRACDHEHPQGLRGPARRGPRSSEGDGHRGRSAGGGADPGRRRALPRVHVDPAARARAAADRELRDARARRPRPALLFPRRDAHAPLARVRGPRGLVPELRLPRTGEHDLQAEDARQGGDADGAAATRARLLGVRGRARLPPVRRHRPQLLDPAGVAAPARRARLGRHALPQGDRDPAARRLQHARQPVLLERDPRSRPDDRRACGRPALRRLQSDERRLPSQPPRHGRRHARRREASVRTGRPRAGVQRDPADDAPAKFSGAAPPAPLSFRRWSEGSLRSLSRRTLSLLRTSPRGPSSARRSPRPGRRRRCRRRGAPPSGRSGLRRPGPPL